MAINNNPLNDTKIFENYPVFMIFLPKITP